MHCIPLRRISTGPSSICNHWWVNSLGIPAKNATDENMNMMGLALQIENILPSIIHTSTGKKYKQQYE